MSVPAYLGGGKGRGRGKGRGGGGLQDNAAPASAFNAWGTMPAGSLWGQARPDPGATRDQSGRGPKGRQGGSPRQVNHQGSNGSGDADIKLSQEERFARASSKIMEASQKHLEKMADLSDEEEEEEVGDHLMEKVFQVYSTNYEEGDSKSLDKAQEDLLHAIRSNTSACLICIEAIKRQDPIWNCVGCRCMFHIQCIQKWVQDGVYQQTALTDLTAASVPWFCPKCRHEYKNMECPKHYYCFCGKVQDPPLDNWLLPHSCGEHCGRQLKPDCGHKCMVLCHPGLCPPCPKTVTVTCHCGKQPPTVRRCSARAWSCNKPCGKRLLCGQHQCEKPCHAGECPPCSKTSQQKCQCGKKSELRPCASLEWQCQEMCGKPLACGFHTCERLCHSGNCGGCPRSGKRKCPCGKTEFSLPCTEDIPTCGDTCGKLLACGLHSCTQRCHNGPCGACQQMTVKQCRCGQRKREVPCSKDFTCDVKCTKLRDCGKHQCKRKCCDGNCPTCEQTCGKSLVCHNHKCASRCHRGQCYPCPLSVTISCFCKSTSITVPCGREKNTKPPRCNYKCRIPPDCHHEERIPHRCHFGECPPCRQLCALPLSACPHRCPLACHDAVKVKMQDKTPRAGPWEGRAGTWTETVKKPCAPCQVPQTVACLGDHEKTPLACSQASRFCCGRACGRLLSCGNHRCSLPCHVVEKAPDLISAGANCQSCEETCSLPRPEGCSHPCLQACHPPPCPPCTQMLPMRCHCRGLLMHKECHVWLALSQKERDAELSCGEPCPKEMRCGHQCGNTCHSGPCRQPEQCEKKVTIRCKCKRQRKEVLCHEVGPLSSKKALPCDQACEKLQAEKKKNQIAAEKAKQEEEEQKKKAELEEFERMMKGRRKKPRHRQQEVVEQTLWERHQGTLKKGMSVVVFLLLLVVTSFYMGLWDIPPNDYFTD